MLAVGDQLATKVCPHPARATLDVYSLLQPGPLVGGWNDSVLRVSQSSRISFLWTIDQAPACRAQLGGYTSHVVAGRSASSSLMQAAKWPGPTIHKGGTALAHAICAARRHACRFAQFAAALAFAMSVASSYDDSSHNKQSNSFGLVEPRSACPQTELNRRSCPAR